MAKKISASVGKGGKNSVSTEIKIIQELLNNAAASAGGPASPLRVDGICGTETITAIEKFQEQHFGRSKVDGRIESDSQTLKKLNELAYSTAAD